MRSYGASQPNGKLTGSARVVALFAGVAFMTGCTSWQDEGSFSRTTQSQLSLESAPAGKAYVDGKYIGDTPLTYSLQYGQDVERKTRKITYWDTQPGLALLLTILSLGFYLPFSAIPVDTETSLEPKNSYTNNHFQVGVDVPGYQPWKQDVTASGEDTIHLQPQLVKASTH